MIDRSSERQSQNGRLRYHVRDVIQVTAEQVEPGAIYVCLISEVTGEKQSNQVH
jgi:hypothetical protein